MYLEIQDFRTQYEDIMGRTSVKQRDLLLSILMTDMEKTFKISVMKTILSEKDDEEIIKLYREVAFSRSVKV